ERLVERRRPGERSREDRLDLLLVEAFERGCFQLAELRPLLDLRLRGDDPRGFDGAPQVARDDAVERDLAERLRRRPRLSPAGLVQADLVGAMRPAVGGEVRDIAVAHKVEPPPRHAAISLSSRAVRASSGTPSSNRAALAS